MCMTNPSSPSIGTCLCGVTWVHSTNKTKKKNPSHHPTAKYNERTGRGANNRLSHGASFTKYSPLPRRVPSKEQIVVHQRNSGSFLKNI